MNYLQNIETKNYCAWISAFSSLTLGYFKWKFLFFLSLISLIYTEKKRKAIYSLIALQYFITFFWFSFWLHIFIFLQLTAAPVFHYQFSLTYLVKLSDWIVEQSLREMAERQKILWATKDKKSWRWLPMRITSIAWHLRKINMENVLTFVAIKILD